MISVHVQVNGNHRPFPINRRTAPRFFPEPVTDGILDPKQSILGMRVNRIPEVAIHREGMVRRHMVFPGVVIDRFVEVILMPDFKLHQR